MSRRIIRFSAPVIAILLLACCGKQHKAETVVKDFIAQNMAVRDYSLEFLKVDSTTHVKDSLINRMKTTAMQNKLFKKDIKYGSDLRSGKYVFLPTRIYVGNDTVYQTFYLDTDISHVIAFK